MTDRTRSFAQMSLLALASAAAFWLLRDHWRHALGFLGYAPYLLFLACPLMHLFMHHGHRHGDHHHGHLQDSRDEPATRPSPR